MGINLLPALGAVGATALGLPAFLGAGLGSAASGSDPENIIKDAALGGIGSFALGGAGTGGGQFANLFTSGGAKKGGGILNYIMNKPGNALQFAGLASSMAGVAQDRNKDPFALRTQLDDLRMSEYIENISDMEDEGIFVDPVSGKQFTSEPARDRFIERKKQMQDPAYLAAGGLIEGPGTGTSDDIPAMIYQDGQPVREAALSNGEVVFSLKDLEQLGNGNAELAGQIIGNAPNGTRGAAAAALFRQMNA